MHKGNAIGGYESGLWMFLFVSVVFLAAAYGAAADTPNTPNNNNERTNKKIEANTGKNRSDKPEKNNSDDGAPQTPAPAVKENARVDDIDLTRAVVTIKDCPWKTADGTVAKMCIGPVISPSVENSVQPELKNLHKGDHVSVGFSEPNKLNTIAIRTLLVDDTTVAFVLAGAFAVCFAFAVVLTLGRPLGLIIGEDGRYSNSKFQMATWFFVLIATYLATIYMRLTRAGWEFFGCVNIPTNLLLLSGLSALTFGGAKGITTSKVEAAQAAGNPNPKPPGQPSLLRDFVQNDAGQFDIGDFQMLVVTLVAIGMYLTTSFHSLTAIESWKTFKLPDVDTTILASFALGQGAYLTKKAVGTPGTT